MGHRVEALQDQLHCSITQWVQQLKVGFFLREIDVEYIGPAQVGDYLEVASWGFELQPEGFLARFAVIDEVKRSARAIGTMRFVTVNAETGRKMPIPDTLPSQADENLLLTRPTSREYLAAVKNVPEEWKS
jgi:acyl-CoA thioesterase FadM